MVRKYLKCWVTVYCENLIVLRLHVVDLFNGYRPKTLWFFLDSPVSDIQRDYTTKVHTRPPPPLGLFWLPPPAMKPPSPAPPWLLYEVVE
jgi:hypothetical protein